MSIAPIEGINLNQIQQITNQNIVDNPTQTPSTSMFKGILDNLVNGVNTTNNALEGDIVKAASGELDNPNQLLIDSTKAKIALQLITSVRNNALSAYNDIIKMSI